MYLCFSLVSVELLLKIPMIFGEIIYSFRYAFYFERMLGAFFVLLSFLVLSFRLNDTFFINLARTCLRNARLFIVFSCRAEMK